MQRDPRPACACAVALSDTFSPCYTVASHRSITRISRVIFSSPSISRLFLASFGPLFRPHPLPTLRSCPSQLTFILSRSRCAELCISEGVKRHNTAILLGASSKNSRRCEWRWALILEGH